jgi:hypothetical protein
MMNPRKKSAQPKSTKIKTKNRSLKDTRGVYLDPIDETLSQFGTFAESKRSPIHRWFQYPAGFSFRAVEHILNEYCIKPGHTVYDPFAGTGTTIVVCKSKGIESYGVEAHPFVYKIALAKTTWDYDYRCLQDTANQLLLEIQFSITESQNIDVMIVPELVRKCFSVANLQKLLHIRSHVEKTAEPYRSFFFVALTCALRQASAAATGWPYIAPKKRIQEKDGLEVFTKQLLLMIADLQSIPEEFRKTPSHIIQGDARKSGLHAEMFDLSFTSPPYLNNYDYADRTRLETYFNGFAHSWGDITEKIRSRLIISATTQINRGDYLVADIISTELKGIAPDIAKTLQQKVNLLSRKRLEHGGKKSYDIMVAQYFNDMTLALMDNWRLLKRGAKSSLILGDSAPYGVYIPTDEYLGQIALGIGFKNFSIQQLRSRGDKWKGNTQRHHIALRESILTLNK